MVGPQAAVGPRFHARIDRIDRIDRIQRVLLVPVGLLIALGRTAAGLTPVPDCGDDR
jgi:hypothetical protein